MQPRKCTSFWFVFFCSGIHSHQSNDLLIELFPLHYVLTPFAQLLLFPVAFFLVITNRLWRHKTNWEEFYVTFY